MLDTLRPAPAAPAAAPSEAGTAPPRWDLLLICVAVYIATAVGRVHLLFDAVAALKPTLVAAVLAVGLYLLQQSGERRLDRLRSRTSLCLLGLLLWSGLSVPTALNQGMAFQFMVDFAKTVVMFFVIAGTVRHARDVERLMLVYVVSTVVYCAVVLSRFKVGGGDDWRLSHLYDYDANDFAALIASAMPLGLYFALAWRRPLGRGFALVGLALLAVGLIYSGSRGGFLALLAVAAFVLVRFTTVSARARLAGLVVILTVVVASASDQYWSQMQTMLKPHEDYNATLEAGRLKIWERGLGYMMSHPITGVGGRNFQVAEGTISPLGKAGEWRGGRGARWGAAHNSFVQVGAELGVPGLLLFVGLLAGGFGALRRAARGATRAGPFAIESRLSQSLMAGLVGFVVGAFFLSLAYSDMLYTLLALALGLAKLARRVTA